MHALRLGSPVRVYTLLAIVVAAAVVPFAHVLGELYNIWNLKPEYSHGIIIPLLSAFLVWRQREQLRQLPFTGSWLGLAPIVAGLAFRYIGQVSGMQTLEHYAFLFVLYGVVLTLVGPVVFRRLRVPLVLLLFAVPLPAIFDSALSLQLQLLSSQLGVWVIRAAGISVLLEGNIIDLGTYQLEVAEACSGLRYLYPLMTLALIVAYFFRGPMWKRVTIFLVSIPITVIMNSLRIGFIGITVEYWGSRMAEGALHDFEGWLVFMLSTGALILVALGLSRVGASHRAWHDTFALEASPLPKPGTRASQANPSQANPSQANSPQSNPPRAVPHSFIAAAVLVLAGAVLDVTVQPPQTVAPARTSLYDFPTSIGDWVGKRDALESRYLDILRLDDYALVDFRQPDGQVVNFYSAYYQSQGATRAIHSPKDCIPGGGWEVSQLEVRTFPATSSTPAFKYNRAIIQLGSQREIVYYWFQERGRRLTDRYNSHLYFLWDALTRHRTDGALVRFVATYPAGAKETEVDARMMRLATTIEPMLGRYIPD